MLRRCSAASAHDADAEVLHELGECFGHRGRLERIHRFADARVERQTGVRDHRQRERRVLGEIANRLAHVLGPGGAVEPDDVNAERFESRHGAGDVGAEEHAAGDVERDLGLERDAAAELLEQLFDSGDGGFDLEDVLRRLDEEEVDAPFYKVLGLVVEIPGELVEGDVAEGGIGARGEHARRAH